MAELYIGLMSGTSLDGIDGVLVDFATQGSGPLRVLAHVHRASCPALGAELLALNSPGDNELHRAALAGNALARACAEVVEAVLTLADTPRSQVRCCGRARSNRAASSAGVRWSRLHTAAEQPGLAGRVGWHRRGGRLAQPRRGRRRPGCTAGAGISSRRVRPAGRDGGGTEHRRHQQPDRAARRWHDDRVRLRPGQRVDGPLVSAAHGPTVDDAGAWAASGQVVEPLLTGMLANPYFATRPPKSTGRDLFHSAWLETQLQTLAAPTKPVDVQATLAEPRPPPAPSMCFRRPSARASCWSAAVAHSTVI